MSTQVVAERVRALIQDSGLNQSEFTVSAGLDAPKLSKSLSGVRRFTSLDLANIAEPAVSASTGCSAPTHPRPRSPPGPRRAAVGRSRWRSTRPRSCRKPAPG